MKQFSFPLTYVEADRFTPSEKLVQSKVLLAGGHGGGSGVPTYINQLSKALGAVHQVEILCDTNQGAYENERDGVTDIHEIKGLFRTLNLPQIFAAGRRFSLLIRGTRPNIVWANSTITIMLARIIHTLQANTDRRLITTYHGVPFGPGRQRGLSMILRLIEYLGLLLARPHELVFISHRDRALVPKFLLRRHKVRYLPNCSDHPIITRTGSLSPATPVRIKMIGRVSYQKNMLAAANLVEHLPKNYRLEIVGRDTNCLKFKKSFLANVPHALHQRIQFSGESQNVPNVLYDADLVLFTSNYEGMSITALEAFQAGVPVAMTDVGGAEEFAAATDYFTLIDVSSKADFCRSAHLIGETVRRYRLAFPRSAHDIQKASRRHFSPDDWRRKVRAIVASESAG